LNLNENLIFKFLFYIYFKLFNYVEFNNKIHTNMNIIVSLSLSLWWWFWLWLWWSW